MTLHPGCPIRHVCATWLPTSLLAWQMSPPQYMHGLAARVLTLSLPRAINVKFPLQPHQKYYITQHGELGFSSLTQMKDDNTTNSHYLTCTVSLWKVGGMYLLTLGVKGVTNPDQSLAVLQRFPVDSVQTERHDEARHPVIELWLALRCDPWRWVVTSALVPRCIMGQ